MESTEGSSLAACLLHWVQSFGGTTKVDSLNGLGDGRILWTILHDIDAQYFTGDLPEPDVSLSGDWTRKWQNLRHIDKQVSLYYRDVCEGQEQLNVNSTPDLKAVATESSLHELGNLIMTIIRAAMASPEANQRMAQRLMSLGREKAMVIASELRNMDEAGYSESEPVSRDESVTHSEQELPEEPTINAIKAPAPGVLYQDPLLEREEELLQAQATIDKLQASHAAAQRQLQELRQDKDRLQEAFDSYRSEIESKGRKVSGDDAVQKLQRQTESDAAYIGDLESQLQSSRTATETYERQLRRQKEDGEGSQQLRDELQMLRADNEELNQKVKANENLKKKIQTLQEQEKAAAALREELKGAHERLLELDRFKQVQAALEKEIIEKMGLIRNQEYQINELTTTRKHAEYDNRVLLQKLQDARERHDRDHEVMEGLRRNLQDSSLVDDMQQQQILENMKDTQTQEEAVLRPQLQQSSETRHLTEKLALLEQQLSAADVRLKKAAERNALLEEQHHQFKSSSAAQQEVVQKQNEQEVARLRQELEHATKAQQKRPATPAKQELATLQRENHLMATAWYDLAGRLTQNGVSLARRRQEPKSWIGKQRALVGPGAARPVT